MRVLITVPRGGIKNKETRRAALSGENVGPGDAVGKLQGGGEEGERTIFREINRDGGIAERFAERKREGECVGGRAARSSTCERENEKHDVARGSDGASEGEKARNTEKDGEKAEEFKG